MNLITQPTLGQSPRLPTPTAVETAIRNGEKMRGKYSVVEVISGDLYTVQNIEDGSRVYAVTVAPFARRCRCKQYEAAQVCKHQYFVDEWIAIKAGEARAEALAEEGITCYH